MTDACSLLVVVRGRSTWMHRKIVDLELFPKRFFSRLSVFSQPLNDKRFFLFFFLGLGDEVIEALREI